MSSENSLSKQLVNLGEKRLFCTFQTPSGLEGGEAVISINQDEIYWVQTFRMSQYGAPAAVQVTIDHTGNSDRNNILFIALQDAKAEAYNRMLEHAEMEGGYDDPDIISVKKDGRAVVVTKHLFHLPYKVQNRFFDNNEREEKPMIDTNKNTGDWASFFLAKEDENASPVRSSFRRRTPANSSNSGSGSSRPRPNELSAAQQQQQRDRNNNVNVNNNINNTGGGGNANANSHLIDNKDDASMGSDNDLSAFHSPTNTNLAK